MQAMPAVAKSFSALARCGDRAALAAGLCAISFLFRRLLCNTCCAALGRPALQYLLQPRFLAVIDMWQIGPDFEAAAGLDSHTRADRGSSTGPYHMTTQQQQPAAIDCDRWSTQDEVFYCHCCAQTIVLLFSIEEAVSEGLSHQAVPKECELRSRVETGGLAHSLKQMVVQPSQDIAWVSFFSYRERNCLLLSAHSVEFDLYPGCA